MSAAWPADVLVPRRVIPLRIAAPREHLTGTACLCAECRSLESLPRRLQGVPGAVQLRMSAL
jgi:hypothetical protein